jgi:hypothetical protein
MSREMRGVIGAAGLAVAFLFIAAVSAQAGGYSVEATYPDYPAVGSYVDHYDHAAAWAWEGSQRATQVTYVVPAETTPVTPKVYTRRGLWGRAYRR